MASFSAAWLAAVLIPVAGGFAIRKMYTAGSLVELESPAAGDDNGDCVGGVELPVCDGEDVALKNGFREKRDSFRFVGCIGGAPKWDPTPGEGGGTVEGKTGLPHRLQPISAIAELDAAMTVEAETGSMISSPAMMAWPTDLLDSQLSSGARSRRKVES